MKHAPWSGRQQNEAFWSAALGFPSETSDCRALGSGRLRWLEMGGGDKKLALEPVRARSFRTFSNLQDVPTSTMLLCPDFDLDEICWIEAPYPEIKWKGTTQLNTAQVTVAMVRDPLAQLQSWRKAAELAKNIKLEECGNDLDRSTCTIAILLKVLLMKTICDAWR